MWQYDTYFLQMPCILQTCPNCGIEKLKKKLLQQNKIKLKGKHKRFLVKQWATKSEIKNGERSNYLAWDHLQLSFENILDLYLNQLSEMSEHIFFASWNYVQYRNCKNLIESGEVVMVQDLPKITFVNYKISPQSFSGYTSKLQHTQQLFILDVLYIIAALSCLKWSMFLMI